MDPITPLLMLWLASRGGAPPQGSTAPRWPTPTSPPPIPAFRPQTVPAPPAPSADPGRTSTPLAELHRSPPKVPPASPPAPKKKAPAVPKVPRMPTLVPGLLQSTLPVAKLQKALIARGAKIVPDGLFGPKTAAAWSTIARSKLLPSAIARVGPKAARVVTSTYDTLSVPPIP